MVGEGFAPTDRSCWRTALGSVLAAEEVVKPSSVLDCCKVSLQ